MIHYTCIYIYTHCIHLLCIHTFMGFRGFMQYVCLRVCIRIYALLMYDHSCIHSFHFISFHFISFHFISFHFISFHFIHSFIHPSMQSLDVTSSFVHWLVRSFIHSFIPRFFISWFVRSLVYLSICLHCVCWGVGYKRIPGGTVQLAGRTDYIVEALQNPK